ncbi:MAG: selenium-dependent xanthine dehydrogenase, partial [Negativicutes bacterium]|nr:selenium-dependent xanthine dehydrogenase [Negativicutes bacterium]
PGERYQGHIIHDWPALVAVGEETRCVGDAIALVAAKTRQQAKNAVGKIRLDYRPLPPVTDVNAALADGAPSIHPKGNVLSHTTVKRGDCQKAMSGCAHVVECEFYTPPTEHAFMEPESALALYRADGRLRVYTGTQSVYDDHEGIVGVLGVSEDEVEVVSKFVGGGFGGKEDLIVQHHAALLASKCRRPVKVTLDRQESINVHPKRHAMHLKYRLGCDEQGMLQALQVEILADTGAYASLGGPVLQRACTHAGGPYKIANVSIDGKAIYTNNPPAGAFRGFGVTQSCFAMESCLNLLAEKVGISPWQIRWQNAIEPGDVMSNGQIAGPDVAFRQTLAAVREVCENNPGYGIACAMKNSGIGVGLPDIGRVRLDIRGGRVIVSTSAACMGQGIGTALVQIVAETTGLPGNRIEAAVPSTSGTPDGGTSTASRQTVFNGEAARLAASLLRAELDRGKTLSELEGRSFYHEYSGVTDPMGCGKENPVSHVAYGFATQVVLLDEQRRVARVIAAHDVGRAINPQIVEGQIEGGVVMGLGYALTEIFPCQEGVPQVKYGTLGLWRATAIPEIIPVIIEGNPEPLAYGAKGVGEIVTIPTAPAVACAYWRADGEFRTRLPLTNTPYSRR